MPAPPRAASSSTSTPRRRIITPTKKQASSRASRGRCRATRDAARGSRARSRDARRNWRKLRPLLAAIAGGQRANLPPGQVATVTAAYEAHIAREERDLIPLAALTFDAATIAEIGHEMALRRGVDLARPEDAVIVTPKAVARSRSRRAGLDTPHAPLALALSLAFCALSGARAQDVAPYAIDIPPWFVDTFLDFREDVRDAAKDDRRLMVYFGQDGCPYCRQLMVTNFSQRRIVDKTRKHFVAVALNIWGDRETTWVDGRVMSEKALARALDVQFTPTLLFFDERMNVVARLNGYYPPHRFEAVLDYVAGKREGSETLAAYLARSTPEAASAGLNSEPFFVKAPFDLTRAAARSRWRSCSKRRRATPATNCIAKDSAESEVRALLARFDVAQFALGARTALTTPDGHGVAADAWARDLGVAYTPSMIFFDDGGREVFRIDAYLRPFHLASALDYVASGAYRSEPSFQRYLLARAERKRAAGERVDMW